MVDNGPLEKVQQRRIAWQSLTLFERIGVYDGLDGTSFDLKKGNTVEMQEFFTEWDEIIAGGDREIHEKRLADEGISKRTCQTSLLTESWPENVELPEWINELNDLVIHSCESEADIRYKGDEHPFIEILAPFASYGYERLLSKVDLIRLSEKALKSIKKWLTTRLIGLSVEALYVEFSTFRMLQKPSLLDEDNLDSQVGATDLYTDFVGKMRTVEGLQSFLAEYPVLARLIITTIRQWIDAISEFHRRLNQDWSDIRTTFTCSNEITCISDLNVLTDDRHHNGRAVIKVALSQSSSVLYKPRSIETEEKYAVLVNNIANATDFEFKTPLTLPKETYGWVEWIPYKECTTVDDVKQYYNRAGAILGISYTSYLNDCHFENIVTHGAHPIIVDTETILHPLTHSREGLSLVEDETVDSVMWTGLLPRRLDSPTGKGEVNISGFQVPILPETEDLSSPMWWENMNQDTMAIANRETSFIEISDSNNVPRLNGTFEGPGAYVDEIKAGFEQMYTFIKDKPNILSPLDNVETRVLFGQTYTYTSILDAITAPAALRSGKNVTLHLEHLIADRSFDGDYTGIRQKIYQAERTAIVRLDVPRFVVTDNKIYWDGEYLGEPTGISGWERAFKKVQSLNDDDLTKQQDYIQTACVPETSPAVTGHTIQSANKGPFPANVGPDWSMEDLVQRIGSHIRGHASTDQSGNVSWIVREYSDNRCLDINKSDNGIYTGRTGIAIFLALLSKYTNSPESRTIALKALSPLRSKLNNDELSNIHLGNSDGLGSHIYSLSKVGQIVDRPQLVNDAELAAQKITEERIKNEEKFDVMNGCAGGLLSLVELYNYRKDDWLLRKAIMCGEHLLQSRCKTNTRYRAWPSNLSTQPLIGFSHGTSGIAYALYRLFNACDDDRFRRAGEEALRYERAMYSSKHQNWPDVRGESSTYLDAWCYGRSGIGLSRLGIAEIAETQLVKEDITNALKHTKNTGGGLPDQLCCGNAGRIEFLLQAAEYTNDSTYAETANRLLSNVLQRTAENQCFALPGHTQTLYNPTLFMGTAGIGYTLLHSQYQTEIPSLLLWE